jgi:hypothetical protein
LTLKRAVFAKMEMWEKSCTSNKQEVYVNLDSNKGCRWCSGGWQEESVPKRAEREAQAAVYPESSSIVMYTPAAKQWLWKHWPFVGSGSVNTFPWQWIRMHR